MYKKNMWTILVLLLVTIFFTYDPTFAVSFDPFPREGGTGGSGKSLIINLNDVKNDIHKDELAYALKLINENRLDEAIDKIQSVLAESPDIASAHEILGFALAKKKEYDSAIVEFQKALKIDPERISALLRLADLYLTKRNINEAKELYLNVIGKDPNQWWAHDRLGTILEREKDLKGALEHYEKSVRTAPSKYLVPRVNLGRLYNRFGQFSKTIRLLEGLVTETTEDASAQLVLGTAYMGVKKVDEAINRFTIVSRLEPDKERGYLSLGIAYRRKQDYSNSLEELDRAIKIKPELSIAYFQKGETYFAMGKWDEARREYEQARKFSSSPGFIKGRIAQAYMAEGKTSEAVEIYHGLINSKDANLATYGLSCRRIHKKQPAR